MPQELKLAPLSARLATHLFVLSALAAAAGEAAAQAAPAQPTETVVVTARRVEERIIDVPLTIKALGARDLQERGITSISELSFFTPGLSYSPDFGRVGERPVVRGISALRTEAPQPVSVFVDGIYVRDGTLGLILDDAQRVEVIKGPQSALYGRSTYAGAINYVTVKPGNKLAGTVTVGSATKAETQLFAAVSAPLVSDVLSMRVKAKRYEYGGDYTNELSGNKVGEERTNAAGLLFNLTPNKDLSVLLSLDQSNDRDGLFAATVRTIPTQVAGVVTNQNGSSNVANGSTCNGRTLNIVGNNPITGLPDANVPAAVTTRVNGWPCGAATFTGTTVRRNEADLATYTDPTTGIAYGNIAGIDRTITRGGVTLNWDFAGGYDFVSQTGVTKQKANTGTDQSYNGTRFAITGASWLTYDRDKLDYYSQEFRLSSPLNQPLTWLVGAFYYHEKTAGLTSGVIVRNTAGQVVNETLRNKSATETTNAAPFARVQYEFTPALRVSAEGRYNEEKVKVGGTPLGTATVTAGTCVAGQVCFLNGERTFKDFSPRVTVDFKPAKDSLLYAQVAKGSKSGGFNLTAGLPAANFSYDGEKIQSGELGLKTVLAGGLAAVNVAIFRNDIDGLQLSNISTVTNPFNGTATTTTIVNNVGKARTTGIELDASLRATNWLSFSGNYAYTVAKARQGTEITNGTAFGGNTSVAGFTLPRTPKNSFTGSIAVDTPSPTDSAIRLFGRVDVIYQSRRYAEIQNLIWADPFTRVNFNLGVKGKNWRVTGWVKNAGNDDTSTNGFRYVDPTTFRRSAVDFLPRLRQIGLTGGLDF